MSTPKTITLKNDFHGTEIKVRRKSAALLQAWRDELTPNDRRTVDRIRRKLCGAEGCTCGTVRGPQEPA